MTIAQLVLPMFLLLGLFLPAGLWLTCMAVFTWVVVAHVRDWNIAKTTIIGVAFAIAVTCVQILTGV